MREYLERNNFKKRLDFLCKNLKNKTITIYGTGKMFQEIVNGYDLSKLNIVNVCDRKYFPEDEKKQEYRYNVISYAYIDKIDTDCILVAVQYYSQIIETLKQKFPDKKIIPFVPFKKKTILKNFLVEIPIIKKYLSKKNNILVLVKTNGKRVYNPKIKNLRVNFRGVNSYIEIHEPFVIEKDLYISCSDDCKIVIGSHAHHKRTHIYAGRANSVFIGKSMTTENIEIHCIYAKNRTVKIGDDCQFAWDIIIRTNDAHTIYDMNTKEPLNPSADVVIGDHVWLTKGVTVMKGAVVPSNCIVGTNSIVNKKFTEENCILAGAPAKIVKTGVNWDRRGVDYFKA